MSAVHALQLKQSDNRVFTGAAPTLLCSATSHCTRCLRTCAPPRRTLGLLAPWETRHARPALASAAATSTAAASSAPPAALQRPGTERHCGRSLHGLAPLCAADPCGTHTVRCRPSLRRDAREPAGVAAGPACQRQRYELAATPTDKQHMAYIPGRTARRPRRVDHGQDAGGQRVSVRTRQNQGIAVRQNPHAVGPFVFTIIYPNEAQNRTTKA
jgi:hypothetical protein